MTATPAVEGWFTTGEQPTLIGSRCTACAAVFFPPVPADSWCRDPHCDGSAFVESPLSRHGEIWSYTDARYAPPPPYVAETEPYEPFALAAVRLPEGLVVLGQVARGYGVADLAVGQAVELVVEEQTPGDLIWRWRPVTGGEAR